MNRLNQLYGIGEECTKDALSLIQSRHAFVLRLIKVADGFTPIVIKNKSKARETWSFFVAKAISGSMISKKGRKSKK